MSTVQIAHTDADLAACFPVMKELSLHLKDAADFIAAVRRRERESYAIAYVAAGGRLVACMGFRVARCWRAAVTITSTTLSRCRRVRSHGHGRTLLDWLETKAKVEGKVAVHLDSGTQRTDAHRFYLRQRFHVQAFHFLKEL